MNFVGCCILCKIVEWVRYTLYIFVEISSVFPFSVPAFLFTCCGNAISRQYWSSEIDGNPCYYSLVCSIFSHFFFSLHSFICSFFDFLSYLTLSVRSIIQAVIICSLLILYSFLQLSIKFICSFVSFLSFLVLSVCSIIQAVIIYSFLIF